MSQEFDHLALATQHVAHFTQRVADQKERLAAPARAGHPINQAASLLKEFEDCLRHAVDHRALIPRELRELGGRR
jgi:hypothetical protein